MKVKAKKPIPASMRSHLEYKESFALNAGKKIEMKKIPDELKDFLEKEKKEVKHGNRLQSTQQH